MDNGWLGGINYYKNLINAIYEYPDRKIEPVIFTGYNCDKKIFEDFPRVQIIRDRIFDFYPYQLAGLLLNKIFNQKFYLLERLLKKNNISVLSHFGSLGENSTIPTIGWIPDFQHKYLPDFFSQEELLHRDHVYQSTCKECTRVIFSSMTAKFDAEKYYPEYEKKYRILHFVTGNMKINNLPEIVTLKTKYQIEGSYFIVPNQFWIHKNHAVILEALNILKLKGYPITVVATGNTSDYRQPDFISSIRKKIQEYNISENFKMLGVVPYDELIQLMVHSIAVINPSLFEGWSTSVEETKTLNLRVILSDIPVHREQNPEKGIFFPPHDSKLLADILLKCLSEAKESHNMEQLNQISKKMNDQKRIFAQNYEKIILETLEVPSSNH
jgi:glycosyltransferase involved in cell wall biosynthesis